jgi:hypothetical protein
MKLSIITGAALLLALSGCTELSERDQALLNKAVADSAAAQRTAQQALETAQAAQAMADGAVQNSADAAKRADKAQAAAEAAAADARKASEKADRVFGHSLRK